MANPQETMSAMAKDAIQIAKQHFEVDLDFQIESIQVVEQMLGELHKEFASNPEMDDVDQLACCFGAYIGECIRQAHPGAHWPGTMPEEGPGFLLLTWLGWESPTLSWCYERLTEGDDHDIWQTYSTLATAIASQDASDTPAAVDLSQSPVPMRNHHDSDEAWAKAIRDRSMDLLRQQGLHAAESLPHPDTQQTLRPAKEIARRLMGLHATVAWCCAPEEAVPSEIIVNYIDNNGLFDLLTEEERDIVNTDRADAIELQGKVGWYTENMWALAWTLGFELVPDIHGTMIDGRVGSALGGQFLDYFEADVDALVTKAGLRHQEEIVAMEDVFYCAHNAHRGLALQNQQAIPACGVVQERRQALTWALSPGVSWDETDLST